MLLKRKNPQHILLALLALFTSMSLLMIGNAYQGLLLPIAGVEAGFSSLTLGLLGTLYFLGYALGSLLGPFVLERAKHIRTFAAMSAIACVMILLHSLWLNPVWWWLCRLITGFCVACLFTVIESWVNDRATPENRGQLMSLYQMLALATIVIGQLMMPLFTPTDPRAFIFIAVLLALAVVPVSLSTNPQPVRQRAGIPPLGMLFKYAPSAVVGVTLIGAANGAFWSLGAVAGLQQGLSQTETTILVSLIVLAGAACQYPVGKCADWFDRRYVMVGIFIGSIMAGLLAAFAPLFGFNSATEQMVLGFLWGFMAFGGYGVALAHAFDRMPSSLYVATSAAMLFLYGLGSVAGPLLASTLMSVAGPSMLYLATALLHSGGTVFLVYRIWIRPETTEESAHYTVTAPIPLPAGGQAEDVALQEQISAVEDMLTHD